MFSWIAHSRKVNFFLKSFNFLLQIDVLFHDKLVLTSQFKLTFYRSVDILNLFATFAFDLLPTLEEFLQTHSRTVVFFSMIPVFNGAL